MEIRFKKGDEVHIGKSKIIIASDLMKFKNTYAIYADIAENAGDLPAYCCTKKLNDKVALIIRDKNKLKEMRFNYRRTKSYILP